MSGQIKRNLSWRALKGRLMALRTGKSFDEIVLSKSLVYRVEQVFLIHGNSGLLLHHLTLEPESAPDADLVAPMLIAIRDVVRESFAVVGDETLERLQVGDLSVIVAQGQHAVLAAVVRGKPPAALPAILQNALEQIHTQLGPELRAFRGDPTPFERVRQTLEGCLVSKFLPE
jgi:OOP family OmpA-OmpF porin